MVRGDSPKNYPVKVFFINSPFEEGNEDVNSFFFVFSQTSRPQDIKTARHLVARMAELVDALVSNTSGSNAVPVRSRLRVLKKGESESES
jgi:hypothetical protein